MKSIKMIALLLLLLPTVVLAQKKTKKPNVPEVFAHARYVYVEAIDGEEFNPNLYPADRMAIADVRDALHKWGRYALTMDRNQAELVFVVRKGRLAGAEARGTVGTGGPYPQTGPQDGQIPGRGQRPQEPGFGVGGEAGPPDDLLQVCLLNADGRLGGPLWIRSFAGGLDAPRVVLFAQFKNDVEKAYPSAPPSAPVKP
jgi:hypothetical protein